MDYLLIDRNLINFTEADYTDFKLVYPSTKDLADISIQLIHDNYNN